MIRNGLDAIFPGFFARDSNPYTTAKGFKVLDTDGSELNTVWFAMVIENGEEIDLEVFDEQEDAEDFARAHAEQNNMIFVKTGMDSLGRTFS